MKSIDTRVIVIREISSMLSTSLKTKWQQLLAIAVSCSALTVSATAGVSPAQAENTQNSSTGMSLYSATPQANQVGQGYIVMEQQGDTLIGAFYYPQSEYSCFTGKQNGQTLNILSLPSHQDPMASFSLSLEEMKPVQEIGSAERQTLAACRQDVIAFLNQRQNALELANHLAE